MNQINSVAAQAVTTSEIRGEVSPITLHPLLAATKAIGQMLGAKTSGDEEYTFFFLGTDCEIQAQQYRDEGFEPEPDHPWQLSVIFNCKDVGAEHDAFAGRIAIALAGVSQIFARVSRPEDQLTCALLSPGELTLLADAILNHATSLPSDTPIAHLNLALARSDELRAMAQTPDPKGSANGN
jgi:hypothetical protein